MLDPFASDLLLQLGQEGWRLHQELAALRELLVERIAASLAEFDAESRRFLLNVKRACFNQRAIGRLASDPHWPALDERLAPGLASRIAALEAAQAENDRQSAALHGQQLERERRHLASLADDNRFLRGIALARPGLVEKVRSKAPALAAAPHLPAPAKWEQSFLRFVTRASSKLSANSTLTACGFAAIEERAFPALRFRPVDREEISLVRAQRPELEQIWSLLTAYPSVRDRCLVAFNDTVQEAGPGQLQYLREQRWIFDQERRAFRYADRDRVKIRLENPALAETRRRLADGPLTYAELLAEVQPPGSAAGKEAIDQLIRLGILLLLPPWPTHEPRLERRLLDFVLSLPPQDGLGEVAAILAELVGLERDFVGAERPESTVRRIGEVFGRLAGAALPLETGREPVPAEVRLFEEVLLVAEGSEDRPELLSVAAPAVEEILETASMVSRFAALFNHRHDVLHTLAAWWREHESRRGRLPFLEVAERFGAVWRDFLEFRKISESSMDSTWNPLGSAALADLQVRRGALLADYRSLLAASPGPGRLSREGLRALVGGLPAAYAPLLGASAFAQPADAAAGTWVFNNLHEGTGRYLSRLTPVLEGRLEERLLDHLAARSRIRLDGEEAELLEVKFPFGHLVRAHHPQTARVLELRGAHFGVPPERLVRLKDLQVHADLDREAFRLTDGAGRRLLPLYVSTLEDSSLPNLLRILLAFGPGEIRNIFPFSPTERRDRTVLFRRLTCGSVVLRRQSWSFDIEALAGRLEHKEAWRAHQEIDRWRRGLDLPLRAFYYESTRHGVTGSRKPQYLDFSSPALVQLFAESLRRSPEPRMMLEEALPAPTDYPLDGAGDARGLELLVDHLMTRPAPAAGPATP